VENLSLSPNQHNKRGAKMAITSSGFNGTVWNSKPTTTEVPTPDLKKDLVDGRNLPVGVAVGSREIATGCTIKGDHTKCKFGRKSPYGTKCTHHRHGIMCDAVLNSEGNKVN
jgi:hypothetical protein